jgi:hypothetical protein
MVNRYRGETSEAFGDIIDHQYRINFATAWLGLSNVQSG